MQHTEESWEKEFEAKLDAGLFDDVQQKRASGKDIKIFIRETLEAQKKELRDAIEAKRMTMRAALETGSDAGAGYTIGYNSALDDILSILT